MLPRVWPLLSISPAPPGARHGHFSPCCCSPQLVSCFMPGPFTDFTDPSKLSQRAVRGSSGSTQSRSSCCSYFSESRTTAPLVSPTSSPNTTPSAQHPWAASCYPLNIPHMHLPQGLCPSSLLGVARSFSRSALAHLAL